MCSASKHELSVVWGIVRSLSTSMWTFLDRCHNAKDLKEKGGLFSTCRLFCLFTWNQTILKVTKQSWLLWESALCLLSIDACFFFLYFLRRWKRFRNFIATPTPPGFTCLFLSLQHNSQRHFPYGHRERLILWLFKQTNEWPLHF